MSSVKLSQIGELSLLEQIRKNFSGKSKRVLVGIGDDAAVVKPAGKTMLLTTDMMVEGIHFDLRFTTPYQIGFKLVSVNVSDIYAMGGKPLYFMLNLAARNTMTLEFIETFFQGVKEAVHFYDATLVGGDLSATEERIFLSATMIGYTERYVKRSGARIGDHIYITGNLGDSACGLELLKKIKQPVLFEKERSLIKEKKGAEKHRFQKSALSWKTMGPLLRRHLLPVAKKTESFVRHASSMIDISDGLLIDLTRLCDESNVGARIYLTNIPISREMKDAAAYLRISPWKLALSGGEDYQILFTAPPGKPVRAQYIGDIVKSERTMIDGSGREKPFSAMGYQHFRKQKEEQ
jgi:thiamine-monophosphate kinase